MNNKIKSYTAEELHKAFIKGATKSGRSFVTPGNKKYFKNPVTLGKPHYLGYNKQLHKEGLI